MSYPSNPTWLDHSNYNLRRVQTMKLLIMLFSPTKVAIHLHLMSKLRMHLLSHVHKHWWDAFICFTFKIRIVSYV
jgi:hypothetical protein